MRGKPFSIGSIYHFLHHNKFLILQYLIIKALQSSFTFLCHTSILLNIHFQIISMHPLILPQCDKASGFTLALQDKSTIHITQVCSMYQVWMNKQWQALSCFKCWTLLQNHSRSGQLTTSTTFSLYEITYFASFGISFK